MFEGVNIGDYGMWMMDVMVDGKVVDLIVNNYDWNFDIWKKSGILCSDVFQIVVFVDIGIIVLLVIIIVNFNFVINLMICDIIVLVIIDDIFFDGQVMMILVYF